jgi:hypothetical protein
MPEEEKNATSNENDSSSKEFSKKEEQKQPVIDKTDQELKSQSLASKPENHINEEDDENHTLSLDRSD